MQQNENLWAQGFPGNLLSIVCFSVILFTAL